MYLTLMSRPVWRMVSMQASSGTTWVPSPRSASEAAATALIAPRPLRSMQGTWTRPWIGIAGHAEVVLERDLGGVLDLGVRAAERAAEPGGGHGGGGADLALAADLGAGDRGVGLDDAADCGRGQQEVADAAVGRADAMVAVVADHRRHHAGGAVGRGGDDAAAGGVLLVDRHRVDREPVVDGVRLGDVVAALGDERLVDGAGAATHPEAARERAVGGEAAVDAVVHHRPDPVEAGVERAVAAGGLVGALHRGDREAGGLAHGEHLGGGGERPGPGDLRVVALEGRALQLALGEDEAAADRIVGFGEVQVAGGVEGAQDHAVGVAGERRAVVEDHALLRIEREGAHAGDVDAAGRAQVGEAALGLARVEGVGNEAEQAEDDRAVGGVALAGEGEAAVQASPRAGRGRRSPGYGRRRRAARRGSGRRRASGPWCARTTGRRRS